MTQTREHISSTPPADGMAVAAIIAAILFWPVGLILSPIALSRIRANGSGGKGLAIAGLIISIVLAVITVVAVVVSVILSAVVVSNVGSAVTDTLDDIGKIDQTVAVGETGTTEQGMAYTVHAVTCGIPSVGTDGLVATAQGQYCRVDLTVANNGTEPGSFYDISDAKAYAGEVEFAADSSAGAYAQTGVDITGEINPGNSDDFQVFFDVPTDVSLDRLTLAENYLGSLIEVTL